MDTPKISVLIPLYNRKHYIAQAVDSVLNQTFQDFELIIRDDSSTDGSAEFVAERYAKQISSGKIKFSRNEKNIGEFPTNNKLVREATGKYFMILHSDDVYLPHALEYMYSVAEKYNADVVHSMTRLITDEDGIIEAGTKLKISPNKPLNFIYNGADVEEAILIPNDPNERFCEEWLNERTFMDVPYNIFKRAFIMDNDLLFWEYRTDLAGGDGFFTLKWLMKAEVFVKISKPFYVYRNAPDALSNQKISPERVAQFVDEQINLVRHLEEYFATEEFFRDNKEHQYLARSNILSLANAWLIKRNGVYKKGVSFKIHKAVEQVFRKYFGEDAAFLTFMFHYVQTLQTKKSVTKLTE